MPLAVTFWGTRGSIPTPGPETARFGGNTPCLTVQREGGRQLILDAGTGIRALGRRLVGDEAEPLDLTILLSHTHWDHIQGLPFFRPLYHRGNTVRIVGPKPANLPLETILRRQLESDVFPVPPEALGARLIVEEATQDSASIDGFLVQTVPLSHTAPTAGYSISDPAGGGRLSYLTDNELGGPRGAISRAKLVRFLQPTDTLVHDAMYFEAEVRERRGWGHSSAVEAVLLAAEAGCHRLALFHHDPEHDEATLERLLEEARRARPPGCQVDIVIATEGTTLSC